MGCIKYRFIFKNNLYILSLVISIGLSFLYACGSETDIRVVDFSKTVVVEQPGKQPSENPAFRVAVAAMISPKDTFVYYRQLLDYIGRNIGRDVQFIQRKTYGEINELLGKGQIDLAFICSGPYVAGKEKYGFELLATPEVQKRHFYQSYLIVNKAKGLQIASAFNSVRLIGILKRGDWRTCV